MIKSYRNDEEELKHYISFIKESTCPLHFTFCNLPDQVLIISKMIKEFQKVLAFDILKNKIIDYLGVWQYDIVKEIVESKRVDNPVFDTIGKNNMFNFGSLFNQLNIYIHYFICSKDDKWLEETLTKLYINLDLSSLDILYQYYIISYLNLDYVYLMDKCSTGFDGIRKLIRKKCNKCVINHSYELQMILKHYVDVPTNTDIMIHECYNTIFSKYIDKVNSIIDSGNLSKHKEQSKRFKYVINYIYKKKNNKQSELNKCSSYKIWLYVLKYIFIKKEPLFINYNSKVCFFVSRYFIRNKYVKKQLAKYNQCLIISYLGILESLVNVLDDENCEKITNHILLLENFIISGITDIQLACTIVKYMHN